MAKKPHIGGTTELSGLIRAQPAAIARVIATRAALRIFPFVGLGRPESGSFFRAAYMSWVISAYPNEYLEKEAQGAGAALKNFVAAGHVTTGLARTALAAAISTYFDSLPGDSSSVAELNIEQLYIDALNAIENAAVAYGGTPTKNAVWANTLVDFGQIEHGSAAASTELVTRLASLPLWSVGVRASTNTPFKIPSRLAYRWDEFRRWNGTNQAGFNVWVPWYEARLRGSQTGGFSPLLQAKEAEILDLRIAKQSEEFWGRDPGGVNAQIQEWVKQIGAEPLYNLIMRHKPGSWNEGSSTLNRSRYLEYTDDSIVSRFKSLDSETIARLLSLPTLFAYEVATNDAARVGKVRDLHVKQGILEIFFELDPDIPPIQPNKFSEIRERLGITNSEQHRTHWAIKKIDLHSVLRDSGIIEVDAVGDTVPTEPSPGPGPQYRPRHGKLSEDSSQPAEGEAVRQAALHHRLRADAKRLADSLQRTANRYPELANTAQEYSQLQSVQIAEVDVTGLWSVGGALVTFARSYQEQNVAQTLAEPLEPQIDGLLQSVVRQHGAFIMGFEQGRDLVRRADEFSVDILRLREIEAPGGRLLNELTINRNLVDDRTRDLHRPVRDSVAEFGWAASRLGYSAYLIVRNGVHAMIKYSVGENPNVGAIVGILTGASVLVGDPNADFIRAAVPVLQQYASQLLVFFNHSPEMRAYVEWALRILEDDHARRPGNTT